MEHYIILPRATVTATPSAEISFSATQSYEYLPGISYPVQALNQHSMETFFPPPRLSGTHFKSVQLSGTHFKFVHHITLSPPHQEIPGCEMYCPMVWSMARIHVPGMVTRGLPGTRVIPGKCSSMASIEHSGTPRSGISHHG